MSKFECKKYYHRCKAQCCGWVPIKRTLWQRKQHAIQRPPKEIFKGTSAEGSIILPHTKDGYCPFLTSDFQCSIYEERPEICRKFGDESDPLLCCPMQDKEGNEKGITQENSE